jgi:TatA/E family protein of Tat protein translocase
MYQWPMPAFLAGSPGPLELVVIFLLILVLFGPRRLPEIAKMIGKALHELRRASEDFRNQVMAIETEVVSESLPDPPIDHDGDPEEAPHETPEDPDESEVRSDLAG